MPESRISRRGFLELWKPALTPAVEDRTRPLASGLEPFVPDAQHPWDAYRTGHLLRRTMLLPTWEEITSLVALGDPMKAVDLLLSTPSTPKEPSVANDATESLEGLDIISRNLVMGQWSSDGASLRNWWSGVLQDAHLTIVEKMVLFWSGHFTTQFVQELDFVVAPLLYRQNQLFRQHALGNFKDLVKGITLDGAMLVYLGGNKNSAVAPNENFARELMELYTTGLGWYTEGDVQNAARILTGWRIAQYTDQPAPNGMFNTYFEPATHDVGAKVFLNTAFPARDASTNTEFLVRKEEIERLIDTLFSERAEAIAKFISTKLYRFFVYSSPVETDQAVIDQLATLMLQQNFEIKPVMRALLLSAHFYDNANIGAQIKTPAEYVIGMARQLDAALPLDTNMTAMDQQLFEPPNVSGWPGYHDWVTTNTYPVRSKVAQAGITALDDDSILTFLKQFADYRDVHLALREICQLLLPRPLSPERETLLVSKMTGGAPDYEWGNIITNSPTTAARNLRDVLNVIVALPDFQLC